MAERDGDLITLPHHVELLSDRWLEEAQRFFRETAAEKRAICAQPIQRNSSKLVVSFLSGSFIIRTLTVRYLTVNNRTKNLPGLQTAPRPVR